jgi:acetyl-CoA carboxylase carboxyltransferase component
MSGGREEPEAAEGAAAGDLRARRERIRTELGGADRVAAIHAAGGRTVRDRIEAFCDPGTFDEVGTFARSERTEDAATTPGDGKVAGHGRVDGRWTAVAGDDITVRRGSSSVVGSRRLRTVIGQALREGHPFVYFGETGGARIPDALGSEGFSKVQPAADLSLRRRQIPMATVIVGPSFGGSSFFSAHSDLVVQVRGSCLAVTSPRVVEIATGERVGMEELGGVDVHAGRTGMIDVAAETEEEAYDTVRRFLAHLPPSAREAAPRAEPPPPADGPDPDLERIVPARRRRAYDMRKVLRRILDPGDPLILGERFGPSVITALGRLDGHAVAIIASQPMFFAGALSPDAIEKATRLVCLADAFDLPLLILQDTPGFFVGLQVEHDRLLAKAIRFQDALVQAGCPKLTVVLRKAYGLAYFSLGGTGMGSDGLYAWPGAEISFMDPDVGANVLFGDRFAALPEAERAAALQEAAADLAADTDPYGAAGIMHLDEVIDPGDTRRVLAGHLDRLQGRRPRPHHERLLAGWPTR